MQKVFNYISEFIDFKKACPFCDKPLKPTLTNFVVFDNKLPLINSKLDNNSFNFDIKHTTININVKATGTLDICTNDLKFNIHPDSSYLNGPLSYIHMMDVFEQFKPHVQLSCINKLCNMDYYCCSNVFSLTLNVDNLKVNEFILYIESSKVGKCLVQNDHIYGLTRIHSMSKAESSPIEMPLLDFESIGKEKLCTRISTIVTFS